jgi:hypothetical protein
VCGGKVELFRDNGTVGLPSIQGTCEPRDSENTSVTASNLFGGLTKLPVLAAAVALASAFSLAALTSFINVNLAATLVGHNAQLEAISKRAEQLQLLTRNIRKASLTSFPQNFVPFGGFIGDVSSLEPGSQLTLDKPDITSRTLEVVSARRIARSFHLVVSTARQVDLMLVTANVVGEPAAPEIRFLVAITPETISEMDDHSL